MNSQERDVVSLVWIVFLDALGVAQDEQQWQAVTVHILFNSLI